MSVSGANDYGPTGLVVAHAGEHTYVTHRGLRRADEFDNVAGSRYMSVADVGNSPVGVAVTPDGSRLYVASMGDDTLAIIDIINEPYRVLTTVSTGLNTSRNHAFVTMAPDGSRAYVTDPGDSRVAVIDIDPANGLPSGVSYIETTVAGLDQIAISPDGTHPSFGVVYADLPNVVAYVSGGGTVTAITELP
jgi:YVTN family beta-propeller protein